MVHDCIGCRMSPNDVGSFLSNVARFGLATANHVLNGMPEASNELQTARHQVCSGCEYKQGNTCTSCNCYLPLKVSWEDSDCPQGKWLIAPSIQSINEKTA